MSYDLCMTDNASNSSRHIMPSTTSGQRAGISSLICVLALVGANTFAADAAGNLETLRLSLLLIFNVTGLLALVLGVMALREHDRSMIVRVATLIGLISCLLLIAELTVME